MPSIAIVTPSFQQGRFLERTLLSVLDQEYPHLEYVVQDGGSTDETAAVVAKYQRRLTHAEMTRDDGQADAVNRGFARTHGEVMAYLNSDDLLMPGALDYAGAYFRDHPNVDAIYGHRIVIDTDDNEIGRWIMPPHSPSALLWNNYVPQETLFWRRRLWDRVGGRMDVDLHSALDWDLLLRFHRAGAVFARAPRFLGAFRIHDAQKTETQKNDRVQSEQRLLREHHHGRMVRQWECRLRAAPFLAKHVLWHRLTQLGVLRYR